MKEAQDQLFMVSDSDLRALYERLRKEAPDSLPSFEEAREQLTERLRTEQLQTAKRQLLERLRRDTYIEIRLAP
jgi:hypothetical protein